MDSSSDTKPVDPGEPSTPRLGWRALAVAGALYTICVSLATWPRILWFQTALPTLGDPLQHLWIMRWYKTCLLEWRSVVVCPEIQYPIGAPLGCFSPLHFQSLLYIPLSFAIKNDVLCYNLIWLFGIVFTGLATFVVTWSTVRDFRSAWLGGMLAMLSGPMLLHAQAHLELIYVGGFPLFLWSWIKFVDRPDRKRLAVTVGLYLLLALLAAYYVVYAVFPAVLYVLWKMKGTGHPAVWAWLRERGAWFAAFVGLTVPGLLLVFGNHLWATAHGYVIGRPITEFIALSAPLWGYASPTSLHWLGHLWPSLAYESSGDVRTMAEDCSYLGLVSLALLLYTAVCRVKFSRAGFWWAVLMLIVVMSGGASWKLGGYEIGLPGLWLKKHFFAFKFIRAPARFNLFAVIVAAFVASNGLKHLLARIGQRWFRVAVFAGLATAAFADLAIVPYDIAFIPPMPGCYAYMRKAAPEGAFVEIPQSSTGGSYLYAVGGYWQSLHRGRTNVGYSGQSNIIFDNLLSWNSPFLAVRLAEPDYLAVPDRVSFDLIGAVSFRDYAWLYLTEHNYRYVVVHRWPGSMPFPLAGLDRVMALLEPAKVYEDAGSVVYDRDRLVPPSHPVSLTTRGWRPAWDGKLLHVANREASLAVYNPDPSRDFRIRLDARAFKHARQVRLVAGGKELARWEIEPGQLQSLESPPFRLPLGCQELTFESDGATRPTFWRDASFVGDLSPYSLKVEKVGLEDASRLARQPPP